MNVGCPRWSSTNARAPRSPARWEAARSTVATMLEPCSPHTHDVRTTVARGAERQRLALPRQLGRAVHRSRRRPVPLDVGPFEHAVEDVVRGDLDQVGADPVAGLGQPAHRHGIRPMGPLRVALARVDGRPRRAVDHGIGPQRGHCGEHGVPVGDVERGVVGGRDVVTRGAPAGHDVVAELPARPRHHQPHRTGSAPPHRRRDRTGVTARSGRTWPRWRPSADATRLRWPGTTRSSPPTRRRSPRTAAATRAPCAPWSSRWRSACRDPGGR